MSPPNTAAEALSGWASSAQAALMIACIGSGPAIASYSRRPATVAAALLPSPARMGISLCTSTLRDGKELVFWRARNLKARSM